MATIWQLLCLTALFCSYFVCQILCFDKLTLDYYLVYSSLSFVGLFQFAVSDVIAACKKLGSCHFQPCLPVCLCCLNIDATCHYWSQHSSFVCHISGCQFEVFIIKKGSPYSITKRRVQEPIPVLGSQPAGDVNHIPEGRLPLLSTRPAVTPATIKRAVTNFAA